MLYKSRMNTSISSADLSGGPAPRRALGLDGVRGLAILLMCLSGVVPNGLPNAMYHGYYPRFLPDGLGGWGPTDNPWQFRGGWPSFTWVDWVFPMFLFAMGAAIPLALGRRRAKGARWYTLTGWVAWRWAALIGFAVYVRQVQPHFIDKSPTTWTWLMGLLGFGLLFPVFVRLPRGWPVKVWLPIRLAGVASCIALICYLNSRPDRVFRWSDNDIIMLLLAHCSLLAGLLWLLTPGRPALRVVLFLPLMLVPHHQAMSDSWRVVGELFTPLSDPLNQPKQWLDFTGWVGATDADPRGWANLGVLWDYTWLKFMWIVLPGTAAGDLLSRWMAGQLGRSGGSGGSQVTSGGWSAGRLAGVAVLLVVAIGGVLLGAKDYGQYVFGLAWLGGRTPWPALMLGLPPLLLAVWLTRRSRAGTQDDVLLSKLAFWSCVTVALGLMLCVVPQFYLYRDGVWGLAWERGLPLEGGLKKGPPATLSYYWLSVGLSLTLLGLLTVVIDRCRWGRRLLAPLVLNGQNPMLAYVGIRNLLAPLVQLPLLKPLGIAGITNLDAWGRLWLPRQIASWTERAALATQPWVLFIWSMTKTVALAMGVAFATKLRVVWRV